jgi:hypothetical protein
MKPNKIIEGNILIAEFMGVNHTTYARDSKPTELDLRFERSWDMLMLVLNKCYMLQMGEGWSKCNCIQYCLSGEDFMRKDSIKTVYEEVLKFIQWYNNIE